MKNITLLLSGRKVVRFAGPSGQPKYKLNKTQTT
jgi:hypothetical protein